MIPITNIYNLKDEDILKKCIEIKKEKTGKKIFAFLVYNFINYELIKRLRDADYVAFLNELTAKNIDIFYFNPTTNLALEVVYDKDSLNNIEYRGENFNKRWKKSSFIVFFSKDLLNRVDIQISTHEELENIIKQSIEIIEKNLSPQDTLEEIKKINSIKIVKNKKLKGLEKLGEFLEKIKVNISINNVTIGNNVNISNSNLGISPKIIKENSNE